jgi:hypothetical protein
MGTIGKSYSKTSAQFLTNEVRNLDYELALAAVELYLVDAYNEGLSEGVKAERERCAKIAEAYDDTLKNSVADYIAIDIRNSNLKA